MDPDLQTAESSRADLQADPAYPRHKGHSPERGERDPRAEAPDPGRPAFRSGPRGYPWPVGGSPDVDAEEASEAPGLLLGCGSFPPSTSHGRGLGDPDPTGIARCPRQIVPVGCPTG